jgi:DNA helicase-2/ATP-dependent DNA helicase PcrA
MDLLKNLNDNQKEAVLATEGPVRVIAGPGTGKTRTLTSRYCHLVAEVGISPQNIFAMTFTNKAADEMKHRVRETLGDAETGVISTVHSFCALFLRDEINKIGFPKNFTILDTHDQKSILKEIFREMSVTSAEMTIKKAFDEILEGKKMRADSYIDEFFLLDNERIKHEFLDPKTTRENAIFLRYLYEQKKNFSLDFNDLINFAAYILENHADVREKWQKRVEYIMIDEFQDISRKQYKIGKILSDYHKNIFIVGDSDQTIYSWRSAHHKLFLNYHLDHEDCATFHLTENYRSTPEILKLADVSISHNGSRFSKELTATLPSGPRPLYFHGKELKEEAKWVVDKIKTIREERPELKNIAVLCRAGLLFKSIEQVLFDEAIPFKHINGRTFYARTEIKDATCYLRMITAGDDTALRRTINKPSRKIGKKSLDLIKEHAEKNNLSLYDSVKSLVKTDKRLREKLFLGYVLPIEDLRREKNNMKADDVFQAILDRTGYEKKIREGGDQEVLDSLAELKRSVSEFVSDPENTLEDFLERAAMTARADQNMYYDAVSLMTVHTAKGLEFETVFVCGLNEGVFPSRRIDTPEEMEEERRLFYVAVTRARKRLFLSSAEGYTLDSVSATKTPSRFLTETVDFLDGEREKDIDVLKEGAIKKPWANLASFDNLFGVGDSVRHFAFGVGEILEVNLEKLAYSIRFSSLPTPRSITFGTKLEANGPETPERN